MAQMQYEDAISTVQVEDSGLREADRILGSGG